MHIVIIGPAYPFRGGIALGNELMAKDFIEHGHDVKLVTFTKQYPSFLFPGKSQFSDSPPPQLPIKREIHAYNPLNWIAAGRRICKAKPDLVIVRFWLPLMGPAFGSILRQIKKNKHTKIIGVLDNVIPHEKRKGDRIFTRFFLAPIDGFVTMAKSVEEDLNQFNQDKPRTIHPHPIFSNFGTKIDRETACKELGIDSSKRTILFFGLIREYKGLDILLESMHLLENINQFQLIIAGESYTNTEKYQELISLYNLDKHVIFHNKFIPDNEVTLYFSAADVLVLPYRSATQSGVTQIAYHFEIPMIVTNVGALPDMVPHEKIGLVTEVSPAACAAAIERFYDEKLGPNFISNFAFEKEKYTWRSFNTEVLHLYTKLVT